jgi:5-methylcytosine-specific restriction endonuclease McrA
MGDKWLGVIIPTGAFLFVVVFYLYARYTERWHESLVRQHRELIRLQSPVERKKQDLSQCVQSQFMIEPCSRCHEFTMTLLEVSPNGRSVHYQCQHCGKKMRAAAGCPEAARIIAIRDEFAVLLSEYRERCAQFWRNVRDYQKRVSETKFEALPDLLELVHFEAPAAPLPYEQTTRSPIPEALRSEVWRRDCGRCVQCGSNQNLQFDHIIPVSRGGATTAANLQLLCEACNKSKGARI